MIDKLRNGSDLDKGCIHEVAKRTIEAPDFPDLPTAETRLKARKQSRGCQAGLNAVIYHKTLSQINVMSDAYVIAVYDGASSAMAGGFDGCETGALASPGVKSCSLSQFMHKITHVRGLNLVECKLVGIFTIQSIEAYEQALLAYFEDYRLSAGYRMLIDLSEASVQQQHIIAALAQHVARMPKASRIAVVTGAVAIKLQARRVLKQPYLEHFDERGPGLTWLMHEVRLQT